MSLFNILLPVMLLTSVFSWADVYFKPVYYADKDKFSIDGYDFFADTQDPQFPIAEEDLLLVVDEGEEHLPGNGWSKKITLVNFKSQEKKTFNTRGMNNSDQGIVAEAIETHRVVRNGFDVGEGFGTTFMWELDVGYVLVLEDGMQLKLRIQKKAGTHWDFPMPDSYNFYILPGDTVKILSEKRQGPNFENSDYEIQIFRDSSLISIFDLAETLWKHPGKLAATGHARNDFNHHGEDESILVVQEVSSTLPIYLADLVRFYGVEGLWQIPYTKIYKSLGVSNSHKYSPYKGKQFEWVYTGKDNSIYVKPVDSDQPIPLTPYP